MEALIQQYPWLDELLMGFIGLSWKHVVMWGVGALLIYLAAAKDYEPALLLPIGFGAILANIPHSSAVSQVKGEEGFLIVLYNAGIANELFPVLIFVAIGAMCDFAPLIRNPKVMLFAAAAQFGIFATAVAATFLGFSFEHAASIGIIGAPTPCSAPPAGGPGCPQLGAGRVFLGLLDPQAPGVDFPGRN